MLNELMKEEKKIFFIPSKVKEEIKKYLKIEVILKKMQKSLNILNDNLILRESSNYRHEEMNFFKNEKKNELIINCSFIENYDIIGLSSYEEGKDYWNNYIIIDEKSTLCFKYNFSCIYELSTQKVLDINYKIIITSIGFLNLKKNTNFEFVIDNNTDIYNLNIEFSFKKRMIIKKLNQLSFFYVEQLIKKFHIENMIKSMNNDLISYGMSPLPIYEIINSFHEEGIFKGLTLKFILKEKSYLNSKKINDYKFENSIILTIIDFGYYQSYDMIINLNHYTKQTYFSNRCKKEEEIFKKEKNDFRNFLNNTIKEIVLKDRVYLLENIDYSKFN